MTHSFPTGRSSDLGGDRAAAVGGAAREPARPGLAATLRRARRDPAAPNRPGPGPRRDRCRRLRRNHRRPRAAPGTQQRVEAPQGGAGSEGVAASLRAGMAEPDHKTRRRFNPPRLASDESQPPTGAHAYSDRKVMVADTRMV